MKSFVLTFLFFVMASMVAVPSAFAQWTCKRVFSDQNFQASQYETLRDEYKGIEFSYTQIPAVPGKDFSYYDVAHIPQVKNSAVIHIAPNGHVSVWHKGVLIEGTGVPLLGIRGGTRKAHHLGTGVAFVLRGLPQGFESRFNQFMIGFKKNLGMTCVSYACGTIRKLGLTDQMPKKFLTASGLFEHMIEMSTLPEKKVEVIAIGVDMAKLPSEIKEHQREFAKEISTEITLLGGVPALGLLYLILR